MIRDDRYGIGCLVSVVAIIIGGIVGLCFLVYDMLHCLAERFFGFPYSRQ